MRKLEKYKRGTMKQILTIIISSVLITSCGIFAEPKDKGLPELRKIEQRWFDGLKVAASTARIGLPSQINNLQAIKRDLDDVKVSKCLYLAKKALARHMDLTIDGFIAFNGNNETESTDLIRQGKQELSFYISAVSNCTSDKPNFEARSLPETPPQSNKKDPWQTEEKLSDGRILSVAKNNSGTHAVFLNGKEIYKKDSDYLQVKKVFPLNQGYAILIYDSCGGTACEHKGHFLTINRDNKITQSEYYYFSGDGDIPVEKIEQQGDTITLLIKGERSEIFDRIVYKDGQIKIQKGAIDNWTNKTGKILPVSEIFKMVGKSPYDILHNIDMKTTIMNALKIDIKTYNNLIDSMGVMDKPIINNSTLILEGCKPHVCGDNPGMLHIRKDGVINVLTLNCPEHKGSYFTNSSQYASSIDETSLSWYKGIVANASNEYSRCQPITVQHKYLAKKETIVLGEKNTR